MFVLVILECVTFGKLCAYQIYSAKLLAFD